MDEATAAVTGAAIGAIGGLSGGWLTARSQRGQIRAEHARWRDEQRRQSYTLFVTAGKQLSGAQWKLSDCLWEPGTGSADWQAQFTLMHDAWSAFSSAAASVTVVGPRAAAEAAEEHRAAMLAVQRTAMD